MEEEKQIIKPKKNLIKLLLPPVVFGIIIFVLLISASLNWIPKIDNYIVLAVVLISAFVIILFHMFKKEMKPAHQVLAILLVALVFLFIFLGFGYEGM